MLGGRRDAAGLQAERERGRELRDLPGVERERAPLLPDEGAAERRHVGDRREVHVDAPALQIAAGCAPLARGDGDVVGGGDLRRRERRRAVRQPLDLAALLVDRDQQLRVAAGDRRAAAALRSGRASATARRCWTRTGSRSRPARRAPPSAAPAAASSPVIPTINRWPSSCAGEFGTGIAASTARRSVPAAPTSARAATTSVTASRATPSLPWPCSPRPSAAARRTPGWDTAARCRSPRRSRPGRRSEAPGRRPASA